MGAPPTLGELPQELLVHILTFLEGETASLCACACLSRSWRDAVATPALWRTLRLRGNFDAMPVVYTEDDETLLDAWGVSADVLRRLVSRAGASLETLELFTEQLTDADLVCLRLPACPALRRVSLLSYFPFRRGKACRLTVGGALHALHGRQLHLLEVAGVNGDEDDDEGDAESDEDFELEAPGCTWMRAVLAAGGVLDDGRQCGTCDRLIRPRDAMRCDNRLCRESWCMFCSEHEENDDCGQFCCTECELEAEFASEDEDDDYLF